MGKVRVWHEDGERPCLNLILGEICYLFTVGVEIISTRDIAHDCTVHHIVCVQRGGARADLLLE